MRAPLAAFVLPILCAAVVSAEEASEPIGGHDRVWWSSQARSHEREIERLEQELATCEEREAPLAYRNVPGQIYRSRDEGLRYRELLRCDDLREALEGAGEARDAFEDLARQLGVPPGWLR